MGYEKGDEEADNLLDGTEAGTVDTDIPEDPQMKGALKPVSEITFREALSGLVGGTAAALGVTTMVINGSVILTMVAGGFAVATGPYLYWQTTRLTDIRTFKEVQKFIEDQVNSLERTNNQIESSLNEMEDTLGNLNKFNTTLKTIQNLGSQTIKDFEEELEIQRQNVEDQKQGLRAQLQELLADILESIDTDSDEIFDVDEIELFIEHLNAIAGICIDEDLIRVRLLGEKIWACLELFRSMYEDKEERQMIWFEGMEPDDEDSDDSESEYEA